MAREEGRELYEVPGKPLPESWDHSRDEENPRHKEGLFNPGFKDKIEGLLGNVWGEGTKLIDSQRPNMGSSQGSDHSSATFVLDVPDLSGG